MPTIAEILTWAVQQHQAGRLEEAERLYRAILDADPHHADALHFLGVIAHQRGRHDEAIALMREAVARNASHAGFHSNLGNVYMAVGQVKEAAAAFREALRLQPDLPQAHNNLANALKELDQTEEAEEHYRRAIQLKPDFAEAHNNLGTILRDQGHADEAVACYEEALRLWPDYASALTNLGTALLLQGQVAEAVACHHEALRLRPDLAEAHNNLGNALKGQGKLAEAAEAFRSALRLQPQSVEAHNNLGNALMDQNLLDEGIRHCREALRLKPDYAYAICNLGMGLMKQGQLAEAMACFRRTLDLDPDAVAARSNLLFCLNMDPNTDEAALFEEHCLWGTMHEAPLLAQALPPTVSPKDRDPERRLRVGYISPDLRRHPVANFLEPILAHHDPAQVEAICYAEVARPDATTARLQTLAHGWRWTCSLPCEEVAKMVRADGIDILVDLAGHTANHRLQVFPYRPAPIQITYLGYPNTSGLTSIDYRLTDAVLEPFDGPMRHTEEVVHLPGGFSCFAPPPQAPEVAPLPALKNSYVTFGSLHRIEKLSAGVFDLWAQVLRAVPSSRLLLFRPELIGEAKESVQRQFAERGVGLERLELRHKPGVRGYLDVCNDIDVSLDVFPWTGHAITCEVLWMGVPMLTLRGSRPANRLSASVLTCLGLTDWIARTPEEYVALAAKLTDDRERLAALRAGLRERMRATICDGKRFTRELEEVYRTLWRRKVASSQ